MKVIQKLDIRWFAGGHRRFAILECEYCGKQIEGMLQRKKSKSCGCATFLKANIKHNMHNTRQYQIWTDMKTRCNNPNNSHYYLYGGRGISYDPKWEKFEGFWEDMKEGYEDNLTIDRIDYNGNYCKENCRWITKTEQSKNRHNHYTFKERPKPLSKSKIPIEKIKTYYEEFQNIIRPNKGNYLKSITDVYNLKPEQVRHLLKKYGELYGKN